jgi:hypothetical protein
LAPAPRFVPTADDHRPSLQSTRPPASAPPAVPASNEAPSLREAFDTFVGETFYGTLLKSMRKTLDKPAYFHGGRAEEIFQGQLDQTLAEEMTKANAEHFTGPMFELFQLSRP